MAKTQLSLPYQDTYVFFLPEASTLCLETLFFFIIITGIGVLDDFMMIKGSKSFKVD